MEKMIYIGIILLILLSAGAVGTVMSRYNMGMMQGNYRGTGPRGCPMMNVEEIQNLNDEYDDNMGDYCTDMTYEECEEMHEDCEEYIHKYCEHNDTIGEGERSWRGCPMMR